MGIINTVVLTEYPTLKSAFIDHSDAFKSRYQLLSRIQANGACDISMENNERHKVLKNVVMSEVTPTKIKKMEQHINQECEKLIKILDQHAVDGDTFVLNNYLVMFTLNVMLRFLFGVDFPYTKVEQTTGIIHAIHDFALSVGDPILSDFLPIKAPKTNLYTEKLYKLSAEVHKMIEKYQAQNKDTLDDTIIGKLINVYNQGKITWQSVTDTCIILVLAGSDTSANTILFCMIEMINNQELQSKVYDNIHSQVCQIGRGDGTAKGVVEYNKHRFSIPYLSMTIKETLRKFPPGIIGLPHLLTEDVVINGYNIAAGTQIIQNIYSTHRSEKYYESPNEFIPERWSQHTNDIELQTQQQADQTLCHFGIGVRDCAGKALAQSEIFCSLATLINRYQFKNPSSIPLNDIGRFGIALIPCDLHITIKRR